jgi:hypothetical protein
MFVAGCSLPTMAWGISAMEMDRTKASVKLIESWVMYILLLISLVMYAEQTGQPHVFMPAVAFQMALGPACGHGLTVA